jgi:uncharacterized protein YyaL (SSP411 family)
MERESFEDETTAELMNANFVSVKVDREERPDLDAIYMDAVQAMTGHGGWPMTVFLTPDGAPFYAGTYFPPEDRHGMPAFRRVLLGVAEAWRDRRGDVAQQSDRVVQAIGSAAAMRESADPLTEDILTAAQAVLRQAFDPEWGGFGGAPKFPQPVTLEFLLRCHLRDYEGTLEMAQVTLDRMAAGGMYDQVGGGFHRYSVDGRWHVPHFEKMLYDNAQLARLYARAWQVTGTDRHRRVAEKTLDYLLREMRHPDGGFHSSQDADSEGEEGRFYVWGWDELVKLGEEALGDPTGAEAVAILFGSLPEGNWEGTNVLWMPRTVDEVSAETGIERDRLLSDAQKVRQRLFEEREGRVRPGTDDKVLAAWNGLAISALAVAGRAFEEPKYVEAAVQAADFVLTNLRSPDGRLLRSWREGRAGVPGFADDHALMAEACLTLYETTFDLRFFREARRLADELLRLFRDEAGGGFFQTGSDAEALVVRPKELFDTAVPSGNSVAAEVLQRLALVTGEADYERAGVSALRLVRQYLLRAPTGVGHALSALDLYLVAAHEVALIGDPAEDETRRLVSVVHGRYRPNMVLALAGPDDAQAREEVALLRDRPPLDGQPTAYVCERFVCRRPVTEPQALAEQLAG